MTSDRFTDTQIRGVIRQAKGGVLVPDLCRKRGIMQCHVLPVVREIWRHGCVYDQWLWQRKTIKLPLFW